MLTISDFIAFLKTKFPSVVFFNSTIGNSIAQCVGIYKRTGPNVQAIGSESSYDILPVNILVHWTEDAGQCESISNSIYTELKSIVKEQTPSGIIISFIQLQDAKPVWVGRDNKNIAENSIRANIIYERGV